MWVRCRARQLGGMITLQFIEDPDIALLVVGLQDARVANLVTIVLHLSVSS